MGFNLNKAIAAKEEILKSFTPLELNEGNVQAIFNRCLAKPDSKKFSYASLFPTTHGYEAGAEKQIQFDTAALVENKRTIEYLFGQIQEAHRTKRPNNLTLDDFNTTYLGNYWTDDKGILLRFLYLGVSPETLCISPFREKTDTAIMAPAVKSTLSPKDPAFPAWWETHKAEWEGWPTHNRTSLKRVCPIQRAYPFCIDSPMIFNFP